MGKIEKFEDIEVWKLARIICQNLETLFNETSLGKNYSLRNQMERSTGSIMDNIAEGFGRGGNKEFHNFLSYSMGSCLEAKSQIYRAYDFQYIDMMEKKRMIENIEKLSFKIIALMKYLRKTDIKGSKFNKK